MGAGAAFATRAGTEDQGDGAAQPRTGAGDASAAEATSRFGILDTGGLTIGIPLDHLVEVATIPRLTPALVPGRGLLGHLELRRRLLPILDLDWLAGRAAGPGAGLPPFAAILRVGDREVGIGIAQAEGLLQLAPQTVQAAAPPHPPPEPRKGSRPEASAPTDAGAAHDLRCIVAGSFLHGDRVVTVVDPQALFALPGLPTAPTPATRAPRAGAAAHADPPKAERHPARAEPRPLLAFSAGGATLGLCAEDIHATVPRRRIEQNALSVGACIGSIRYHGQRIPVLRTPAIVGLGDDLQGIEAEIVILRCGGDRRIGLAVDSITRMTTFDPGRLPAPPPVLQGAHPVIAGVLAGQNAREQVFLLDADGLRALPLVAELAEMSAAMDRAAASRSAATAQADRTDVVPERVRHLVFDAGTALAAPVAQILRVMTPPETLVPSPATGRAGVRGVFPVDGRPALYVDLAEILGLRPSPDAPSRLLLIGQGESRIGFAVRSVDGIETSAWRRSARTEGAAIVQLGRGAAKRVLPALDLLRLSDPFLA